MTDLCRAAYMCTNAFNLVFLFIFSFFISRYLRFIRPFYIANVAPLVSQLTDFKRRNNSQGACSALQNYFMTEFRTGTVHKPSERKSEMYEDKYQIPVYFSNCHVAL